MELKDVASKIVKDSELKARLRKLNSFEEIYDFFVENGYEGDKNELKEKLFKSSVPFRALTDDDLADISGGISGRQALSACMGLMILTGVGTDMLGINSYAGAKSAETSVTSVVSKQSFGDKVRKKLSQLAEKLGIKTGSKEIKPKSAKELKKEEHEKLLRFADICTDYWVSRYAMTIFENRDQVGNDWKFYAFSHVGKIKYTLDYYNFDYGIDVTEYKAKLDNLINETNFKNFDQKDFDHKLDGIVDSFYKSEKSISRNDDEYELMLETGLSKSEKLDMLKSLNKKMSAFDEQLGISSWPKELLNFIHAYIGYHMAWYDFHQMVSEDDGDAGIKKVAQMMGMSKKEIKEMFKKFGS